MRSVAVVVVLVACGGSKGPERPTAKFECRDRSGSYTIAGHISGDELGVLFDCATPQGPRIVRWKVDRKGTRVEDAHSLTTGQFDKLWADIDGTGWRNMKDCSGSGEKRDPVYTFDIHDDADKASFSCQARTMKYPYNDLVDPLDLAATQGRPQLGGDVK